MTFLRLGRQIIPHTPRP